MEILELQSYQDFLTTTSQKWFKLFTSMVELSTSSLGTLLWSFLELRHPFAKDQALRATACAKEMQAKMVDLNKKWNKEDIPILKMRIGIHQGPLVVGTFGCPERSDYTSIGFNSQYCFQNRVC